MNNKDTEAPKCTNCGHNNFENRRGYCVEPVPHNLGRALCGCKCEFAAPVDSQGAKNSVDVSVLTGYEAGLKDGQDEMRTTCVAKLKQIAADYDNVQQPNTGAAISKQAIMYAARQLSSLTPDQVKQKEQSNGTNTNTR